MTKATDPDVAARRRSLGAAIRQARGGRSQADVAAALGVPQPSICRWEQGRYDLTCEQVRRLEVELGVSVGSLAAAGGYGRPTDAELLGDLLRSIWTVSTEEALGTARAASALGLPVWLSGRPELDPTDHSVVSFRWEIVVATL